MLQTGTWAADEVERLRPFFAAAADGRRSWTAAAAAVGTRGAQACKNQFRHMLKKGLVPEEHVTTADREFLQGRARRQAGVNARKRERRAARNQ